MRRFAGRCYHRSSEVLIVIVTFCLRVQIAFEAISPNSCLQHGVLALNLDNCFGIVGFASRRRPSLLSHVSSAVQHLDSALLRLLLWPLKKSTLETGSSLAGSMGGSFLSHVLANIHIFELAHVFSTAVTIKLLQNHM